jgi:CBS domain-containing protein
MSGGAGWPARRIAARVPAHVDGLTSLRKVSQLMRKSGLGAVLVDNPAGPLGLVTAMDIVEAVARGGDPDVL